MNARHKKLVLKENSLLKVLLQQVNFENLHSAGGTQV